MKGSKRVERQYKRQSEFTDKVLVSLYGSKPENLSSAELMDYTQKMVLSLHREVDELLDEIPWKHHRLYDGANIIRTNVLEELIDVIKFALSTARAYNFTVEEVLDAFELKSDVVEDRWRQEHTPLNIDSDQKLVLVDLDGVLNEYPDPFLNFVFQQTGVRYEDMEDLEAADPALKRQMKHEYRESGIKRDLEPIPSSIVACQMLDAAGYGVVIMSQRPYQTYARIYSDTVFWLKKHHVPYKRLLFVPDKGHRLLFAPFKDRIEFAVDDDPGVVKALRELGIKTYWLSWTEVPVLEPGKEEVFQMVAIPEVQNCVSNFRKVVRGK